MFQKILLAVDGSEHSLRATDHVIGLAQLSTDVSIDLVHVLDDSKTKTDVLHHWNTPDISLQRIEAIKPIEQKLNTAGVQYETVILRGNPGAEIVRYANDRAFDLVVIGSRGLNKMQEFVLGSVSHKVAKRSNHSTMIVK